MNRRIGNRAAELCANTRDGATATPGPERRSPGRGSSLGFPAPRASVPGWRPCWPLCRRPPSSSAGDGGYAGQDEITSDSICIYGGVPPAMTSPPARTHHRHGDRRSGPGVGWAGITGLAVDHRKHLGKRGLARQRCVALAAVLIEPPLQRRVGALQISSPCVLDGNHWITPLVTSDRLSCSGAWERAWLARLPRHADRAVIPVPP